MRSGSEHCGSRVAVEQEDEEDNERRRRGEEEEEDQATDIKSNNPHLAGGEKQVIYILIVYTTHKNCKLGDGSLLLY